MHRAPSWIARRERRSENRDTSDLQRGRDYLWSVPSLLPLPGHGAIPRPRDEAEAVGSAFNPNPEDVKIRRLRRFKSLEAKPCIKALHRKVGNKW
jgi:hypothetical protein